MSLQVALLRGVNLGKRQVVMSELRALCEEAGFTEVRTLLASGNLVLDAKLKGETLEAKLEQVILDGLGLKTDVHVRDAVGMSSVLAANPFTDFAAEHPSKLGVLFVRNKLTAAERKALEAPQGGPEEVRAIGREVFVMYPEGMGRSKLKLNVNQPGTMRNWNTVTKLAAMVAGHA